MSAINSSYPGTLFSRGLALTIFVLLILAGSARSTRAATLVVPAGGDFQAALNAAQCGDTIILQAGATYLVSTLEQPFVAKAKGQCTGTGADFITIQGSNAAALPDSLRPLSPDQINALNFPKLVTQVSTPALEFQAGSHHYRFLGIEITNDINQANLNNGLVFVGENSGSQLAITLANVPHDIEFDRCYVHAAGTDGTTSEYSTSIRGFSVSAQSLTIKHSRIAGFRIFWKPGQTNPLSSNAVLINKGPGPYTIVDNYLEAWFGTIFTGGGPQWVVNSANVAAGATTTQATLTNIVGSLPAVGDYIAFRAPGMTYSVGVYHGQSYEWGAAKVTAVSGNTVTYLPQSSHNEQSVWGVGPGGTPLTSAPSAPGMAVWNGDRPKDILIERNQFVKEPVSLASVYAQYGYGPKGHIELKVGLRTTINANTFEGYQLAFVITSRNQASQQEGAGREVWSTIDDTVFTNNWVKPAPGTGHIFGIQLEDETCTVAPGSNMRVENNLFATGTKFINVASSKNVQFIHNTFPGNSGTPTDNDQAVFIFGGPSENLALRDNIFYNNAGGLNCQIPPNTQSVCLPNLAATKNVIIDNRTSATKAFQGSLANIYPVGNFFPNTIAELQFQDPANGNWRLSASSPFKGQGTGGTDPGVDLEALQAALGGSTASPTPTPTPVASPSPSPTPGTAATASFVRFDSTTQGNWKGIYGVQGYNIVDDSASYPSYAQVSALGQNSHVWAASTSDVRGLQKVVPNDRLAASWFSPTTFTIDVGLNDGLTHQVALYCIDWDGNGRSQMIDVVDASTNALLDSRSVSAFSGGEYMVWNLTGHVKLNFTRVGGANSVISGIYFDSPSPVTPTPTPTPTPVSNVAPTVAITSPANLSRYQAESDLTMTVAANDSDGTVVRVDYYRDGALVGTTRSAPFTVVWHNIPSGQCSLTAIAFDSAGGSATSTPVNISIRKSPNTVSTAKDLANSIVGDFDWTTSGYEGAADSVISPSASAVTADLATLMHQIQQANADFNAERAFFDPTGNAISTQLQAADYFARADAALAAKSGPSPSLKAHLERIIGHLSITHDLMLYGNITPETVQLANTVGARTDLVIGGLNSGYSPAAGGLVAPGSIGSVFENVAQISLGTETRFARPGADQSLPYELSGVSVTVAGEAVPVFYVSPTRVNFFVPADLPTGGAAVIVVSQNGSVSAGTIGIVPNVTRVMTMIDDEAGQAVAFNGVKQVMETFSVTTSQNPGSDKRTRVMFFATGVSGSAANTDSNNDLRLGASVIANLAESVIVEARTSDGRIYQLPVEFAGAQGSFPGLDQISVVLRPELQNAGNVSLTLIVNGQRSNAPTIVVH